MTTCAKCGSSLMPGSNTCPRCGTTATGKGSAVAALAVAGAVAVAGIAGAVFFLAQSEPEAPAEEPKPLEISQPVPAAEPTPVLVPRGQVDPGEAEQQVLAALAQASAQIEEAKKHVRDPEVRRQLDHALGQVRRAGGADAGAEVAEAGPSRCDPERIRQASRAGARDVRGCFDQRLKSSPGLQGVLIVHLTVEPSGAVSSAEVTEDTVRDAALASCVREAAGKWRLPAAEQPCSFSVSFPFRSAR